MTWEPITNILVSLNFDKEKIPVGKLATNKGVIYFEYHESFLEHNLEISPIHLPARPGLRSFQRDLFEGLPGVFNDSLPDGWGRLLLDRTMRQQGLPEQLGILDRLAHVGTSGMGALTYEPDHSPNQSSRSILNLDELAKQAQEVLNDQTETALKQLLELNGSSAGARPKALIGLSTDKKTTIHGVHDLPEGFEPWLVKFPNIHDGSDAGAIEYVYSLMAQEAGVEMMPCHLLPAKDSPGYFTTKRFDRKGSKHIHVHTACGLLHSDFRTPTLDYQELLELTLHLTKDIQEVEKMFHLAVFNVLAHNRDDHSKNFSFLMDETGEWKLSPGYDLTFSFGPNKEQSTMVLGQGKNPGPEHLEKLGTIAGLNKKVITDTIKQTQASLKQWKNLAKKFNVEKNNLEQIASHLNT